MYGKTGLYTHTINGGKMGVVYNEVTGNNITIDNAYPLTNKEALTKAMKASIDFVSLPFDKVMSMYNTKG